jgi:hypothetical protein
MQKKKNDLKNWPTKIVWQICRLVSDGQFSLCLRRKKSYHLQMDANKNDTKIGF